MYDQFIRKSEISKIIFSNDLDLMVETETWTKDVTDKLLIIKCY